MAENSAVRSQASVRTASASDYVSRLAKHFAHKVDVATDGDRATFRFSCGTAHVVARDGVLSVTIEASDAGGRAETEDVVESHLLRFGHRESLPAFHWIPGRR